MLNLKRHLLPLLIIAVGSLAGTEAMAQSTALVQKGNLTLEGTFKLPAVSGNGFSYGGSALAFNPANNSLFIVGHTYDQHTAEVKVPSMGGTATVVQSLTDALGGKLSSIGSGSARIGGNLVYNNRLYTSAFLYYDGSGAQSVSHFSRSSLSLSGGSVSGPSRVGSMGAGMYSGPMTPIPAEWQSKLGGPAITGNCCLSIISRTSFGPAAFAFNPESMGNAQPLLYYNSDHQTLGTYGASGSHPEFNGTTRITGVVFPQGTASVLFFGSTGTGSYCYGEGSSCGDPASSSKGEHAYPYKAYAWAYNANDLAAVKAGSKQPWDVRPYATWVVSEIGDVGYDFSIGGAAYDPSTNRIFVSKTMGDGDRPLIYVFKVNNAATVAVPQAPGNVRAE